MIKPDGQPGMAWHRYRRLLATPLEKGKLRFEDKFDPAEEQAGRSARAGSRVHYAGRSAANFATIELR